MKILTSELKSKLKLLKPVLDSKAQITALQGVLLKDNTLTAYNLETALTAKISIDTDDCFIIPPKAIDILQSITDEYVELSYENNLLTITFGKSKSKYQTVDANEYPEVPTIKEDAAKAQINALHLVDAIKKSMYVIPESSSMPILTGLLFRAQGGSLDLVACDGVRLALASIECDKELNFVVPRKSLTFLQSFSMHKDDTMSITATNKHIIFSINEYCIISRLLEGNFIDYKSAIPNHEIAFEVNRNSMLEIFNRMNLLQPDKRSTPAKVTFQKDEIYAEINVENSEYSDTFAAQSNLTEPITLGVNSHFMVACLRSFSTDEVTIHIGSAVTPIVVVADNQQALVLPVRLKTQ